MSAAQVARGDVWWGSLDPTQGSAIKKTRPCKEASVASLLPAKQSPHPVHPVNPVKESSQEEKPRAPFYFSSMNPASRGTL